jgi:peroxiredoxin
MLVVGLCVQAAFAAKAKKSSSAADIDEDSGAPDFPPGVFSDGGHYHLSDFRGKLVVLFFYESTCPRCKGLIPDRNKVVAEFKDKPVKFVAVSPHDTLFEARSYITETHLAMPVFADTFNIMETMYGQDISLNNIYQFRIIGPDGRIVGYEMTTAAVEQALSRVKWKYRDEGYDPALNQVIALLEWNQFEPGVRLLQPMRKSSTKTLAASAEKLYQAVHAEGEAWMKSADTLLESKPARAYDLYTKVAAVFAGDELGKSAAESLKTLANNPKVQAELSARQMYAQLYDAVPRASLKQKGQIIDFCRGINAQYPDTPTAAKAARLADALEKAPSPQ